MTAIHDGHSTGAVGQRWKHRSEGYVVVLEGWIPGIRSWSANRDGSDWTEIVRDGDLGAEFVLVGEESDGR